MEDWIVQQLQSCLQSSAASPSYIAAEIQQTRRLVKSVFLALPPSHVHIPPKSPAAIRAVHQPAHQMNGKGEVGPREEKPTPPPPPRHRTICAIRRGLGKAAGYQRRTYIPSRQKPRSTSESDAMPVERLRESVLLQGGSNCHTSPKEAASSGVLSVVFRCHRVQNGGLRHKRSRSTD
ncbi:hypothetical protein ACLOJK_039300 [Asimina triloba]